MPERKTLFEQYTEWLESPGAPNMAASKRLSIVHFASQELEAIRSQYEGRIERLELDVERLMQRVGDLEVRRG